MGARPTSRGYAAGCGNWSSGQRREMARSCWPGGRRPTSPPGARRCCRPWPSWPGDAGVMMAVRARVTLLFDRYSRLRRGTGSRARTRGAGSCARGGDPRAGRCPLRMSCPFIAWRAGLDLGVPLDRHQETTTCRWLGRAWLWAGEATRGAAGRRSPRPAGNPPVVHRGDLLTACRPWPRKAPPEATLVVVPLRRDGRYVSRRCGGVRRDWSADLGACGVQRGNRASWAGACPAAFTGAQLSSDAGRATNTSPSPTPTAPGGKWLPAPAA